MEAINTGRITKNIIDAYIKLRDKVNISTFKRFNIVIIMHPKAFMKLRKETPYGMRVDKDIEFLIMTQQDYERIEKEKMFERFNKMFFEY